MRPGVVGATALRAGALWRREKGERKARSRRGGNGRESGKESGTLRTWIPLSSFAFSFLISCAFIPPTFFFNTYKGKSFFTRSIF